MPIKKIVAVCLVALILGVFLWFSSNIFSMIQNYSKGSSYSQVSVFATNITKTQFGDIDYSFETSMPLQPYGRLSMWDSLVESKDYNLTEGAVYRDFGIEMKVKEIHSDYAVLLVKPTVQNYLSESGFIKLTIPEGQMQTLSFLGGNDYTISYSKAHIYLHLLFQSTPLLQFRDYALTIVPTIIHSDLGLEIRVSSITIDYVMIFVKPTY
jgi:hypothetical protein